MKMTLFVLSLCLSLSCLGRDVFDSEGTPIPNDLGLISRQIPLYLERENVSKLDQMLISNNFPMAYGFIAKLLKNIKPFDDDTHFWFNKAEGINRGTGPAAMMIRNYVVIGLRLIGKEPPDLQKLSNAIAVSVLSDVIDSESIPPLQNILAKDIQAAMLLGGIKDLAGWGGSFYYWRLPIVDTQTGLPVLDPLSECEEDYLTIGDTILRDVDQRKRFITTASLAFKSVDPMTALSDPQGIVEALKTFNKLPEIVRKPILQKLFSPTLRRKM